MFFNSGALFRHCNNRDRNGETKKSLVPSKCNHRRYLWSEVDVISRSSHSLQNDKLYLRRGKVNSD